MKGFLKMDCRMAGIDGRFSDIRVQDSCRCRELTQFCHSLSPILRYFMVFFKFFFYKNVAFM